VTAERWAGLSLSIIGVMSIGRILPQRQALCRNRAFHFKRIASPLLHQWAKRWYTGFS